MHFAICLAGALSAVALLAQAGAAAAGCDEVFRFEANAKLGVADIAGLAPAQGPTNDLADRILVVRAFRPSARPVREGWTALAAIYATTSGVPVDTVGGLLWTRKPEGFAADKVATYGQDGKALEARFSAVATAAACPAGFLFRLDKAGRVTAGGKPIGVVFPEAAR